VYQGRLSDDNRPANGTYDFQVSLFDAASGGSSVAGPLSFSSSGVTNGLFQLSLDFGNGVFAGASRWVEVSVRTNGAPTFSVLSPRRPLLPSPQAVFATTAATALSVPASALRGTVATSNLPPASTDGSGLLNLNASALASGTVPDARLSASIARVAGVETLVLGASNAVASLVLSSSNALSGQLVVVGNEVSGQVAGVSNAVTALVASSSNAVTSQVLVSSNQLNSALYSAQSTLQAQVNALAARMDAFLAASYPANGAVAPALPSGLTVVSPVAADASLLSQGLVPFSKVDAPPWTTGSTLNAAGARQQHGAVWTGTNMLVWGGLNGTTPLNGGGIYHVASDSWSAMATVNAPAARRGHAMAWTGSRRGVWGGVSDSYLGTGGMYAPDAQTWTATTTAGAPSARTEHAHAWTTARLFVWGGRNDDGLLADGGTFDPIGNLWEATPTSGAPSARRGATATWCGDRVVVFGGQGQAGELNTGAMLPMAGGVTQGSWTPLATTGAPVARQGHSAVWTGTRLLVWGGKVGGVPLNSGASYDPATDTWNALPTVNAPTARWGHVAVWTGREMVVFGGEDGTEALVTGGGYDPATGVWHNLSTGGNALARRGHTGVWTGTELVVFGGLGTGTSPTALGAVQRLVPDATWYFYRKP
jgi:hypothetical protein